LFFLQVGSIARRRRWHVDLSYETMEWMLHNLVTDGRWDKIQNSELFRRRIDIFPLSRKADISPPNYDLIAAECRYLIVVQGVLYTLVRSLTSSSVFNRSYLSNGRAIGIVVVRLSWMYCGKTFYTNN